MDKRYKDEDMVGKKYGKLTVKSLDHIDKNRNRIWLCECECGNEKLASSHRLIHGLTTDCGCARAAQNLTGMKYGRLFVKERVPNTYGKNGKAVVQWLCQCDCGNQTIVYSSDLKSGKTLSCGCQRVDNNKSRTTIRYEENKHLYYVYQAMKDRCNKPSNKNYISYGGRGIKVCEKWNDSHGFADFYEWSIKNGYKEGLTIDRIDNDRDYEPSNCRWVTRLVQANNTRRNVYAEYKGETKTLSSWGKELGINIKLLCYHYKKGKSIEEIITFYEKKRTKHEIPTNKTCQMA